MIIWYHELNSKPNLQCSYLFIFPAASPRLGINTRAKITIKDNDNPYGSISLTSKAQTVKESAGVSSIELKRQGGAFSTSKVLLRTIGGGESWESQVINSLPINSPLRVAYSQRSKAAIAGQDYTPLNVEVRFEVSVISEISGRGRL